MNVSFGKLNVTWRKTPTPAQKKVSDKIEAALDPDWVEEVQGAGENITKKVEQKKGANIDVTLRKNGTFSIKVRKELPTVEDEHKYYTPYSYYDGRKLETTINANDKSSAINRKLKTFISRCELYALQSNSWKNVKIEQKAESKFERDLCKASK